MKGWPYRNFWGYFLFRLYHFHLFSPDVFFCAFYYILNLQHWIVDSILKHAQTSPGLAMYWST